jgi:hypothetical protein
LINTQNVIGSVSISTGGDMDTINLGKLTEGFGLDSIYVPVTVDGGDGDDTLLVDDSALSRETNGLLTAGSIFGLLNGVDAVPFLLADLDYDDIEILNIKLSSAGNTFEVQSTAPDMTTNIIFQGGTDKITINETQGDITVDAGGGDDIFYIYGLGNFPNSTATFSGDAGNDIIWIDGTNNSQTDPPVNFFEGSTLRWSGGADDDTMHIKLSSLGSSNIDIFNDVDGINDVNIDCADADTVMLSRENFLANIHNLSDSNTTVERINLIREADDTELSNWRDTASINTIVIHLNEGENEMHFDDTFAPMDVYGGSLDDGEYPALSIFHAALM